MSLDWPVIVSGTKAILDPIASASWPIAFGAVAYGFRIPITALLERIKSVSGWGASLDVMPSGGVVAHQQDRSSDAIETAVSPSDTLPQPDPVFDPFDKQLIDNLDRVVTGDDRLKLIWAVRQRSISEVTRIHETAYRLIFGSQITALVSLNQVGQASIAIFEKYYEEQVRTVPANEPIHRERSFEQWGNFLVGIGYVELDESVEDPVARITPLGRSFCAWLGYAGVPQLKPG